MSPEAEYFLTHCFLEAVYKSQRYNHSSYANRSGSDCKPDNETGKRLLSVKCNAFRYINSNIQSA
jgi:hypothetical protein